MYKNMPCHKFVHFQNGVKKTEACGRSECCGCLYNCFQNSGTQQKTALENFENIDFSMR